ncbi:MAG: hypothetical protein ACFFCI_00940 [Promethearchaeota archaeon]
MKVKIKRKTKREILIGIIIGLMICSVLSMLAQFGIATQDDEDIEVTLSATLQTDSSEIYSTLMPTGTYSFFDEPELDTGSFTHDATRIDVTNLQYPTYNETSPKEYRKNDGLIGNFSVNTSKIEQYTLSAPFDSTILLNISYTKNITSFDQIINSYDLSGDIDLTDLYGITYTGGNFYVLDYHDSTHMYVRKYNSDFSSLVTTTNLYGVGGFLVGLSITYYGGYFYLYGMYSGDYSWYIFKFSSTFSYTAKYSVPIGVGGGGIDYYNGYWYLGKLNDYSVYKYSSDFSSYTVISTPNSRISTLEYYNGYFYLVDFGVRIDVYDTDFTYLNEYDIGALGANDASIGLTHDGTYFYTGDNDDSVIYQYKGYDCEYDSLFEDIWVEGFNYTKLGIPYNDTILSVYDDEVSDHEITEYSGFVIYYIDSSMFSEYDYVNDITVLEQNLSLIINLVDYDDDIDINMSIVISYSTCEWKVPTEVALTINSEEVIDSTYNSGGISTETYPTSLVITATDTVYFRLNITIDFSFTFNLQIISKTYLRKSFELESNHEIELEQVALDEGLNIKKVYLNNIDWGSSNPTVFSPSVSMAEGNEYTLEVLLIDEIYLPLAYIYNSLGSGTSNIYLSGISNTLTYTNINGNQLYSLIIPAGWYVEEGYLTFSNLDYTPSYTPDYTNDLSGYGYGSSSYGDEDVSWSERYYQTNQNGSKVAESGNSGYESVWEEYFNALNGYMTHTYGDLDGLNSTYTVSDYLYMQNIFPSNFTFEQWSSWVLSYNSDYSDSSWDSGNIELSSRLNEGQDSTVPLNTSFSLINGTHTSNGSLWDIDADYPVFESTISSASGTYPATYSFTDDAVGGNPTDWTVYETGGTVNVIADLDGHSQIVELHDTGTYVEMYNAISQTSGTIEAWIRTSDATYTNLFYITDDNNGGGTENGVWMGIDHEKIYYYDGSSHDIMDASDDTWYHIKIQFDTTDWHLWVDGVSKDGGAGYNLYGSVSSFTEVEFLTWTSDANYYYYVDAVGYSWDGGYNVGDNENPLPSGDVCINMTSEFSFTTEGLQSNDTIDFIRLYYSQKTNESEQLDFYIWNNDNSNWDLVNSSTNNANFYNLYFSLNSSHYNATNDVLLKWYCNATSVTAFELYIDKLLILVNWTKTSGEIYTSLDKYIDFSILNRYDSEANYEDLYNVTIEFLYRYSNYTHYSEYAQLDYYNTSEILTKDESWHEASLNFEFNSSDIDSFHVLFNITNGLLEIKNLNYTIFFECLHTSGYNQIYQRFRYIPSLSLNDLQRLRGNWILNFTYNFTASSDLDYYNFYNSFNYSLLSFQIYVNTENGWEDPVSYDYNTTQSNIAFTFNITQYIEDCGASEFNDLYLEFYLTGNPSEFELDDLILFDFDSDFYEVSALWISDTLVVSHQNISCYWSASDRYISHVEINQTYDFTSNFIYNFTLINNTIQSVEFFNVSAGFYELNFTFFDNYSNWERWTLNFTIISSISISIGYENPVFINSNNTIEVHTMSEYSITQIYYENGTDFINYYDNSSYPLYETEFNFTLSYSLETLYNISVLVISEYNDSFWVNVTNLAYIERTTMLNINNLYYSYYQDERLNVTIILRDLYNNPISNKLLNYTIVDSTDVCIVNSSDTTDGSGGINFGLDFNISCEIGFWHLNASFNGTQDYTSVWKLQSFQVRPILRSVNSTDINLKVNGYDVLNNYIQINNTNNFTLSNNNTAVFDMTISAKLNYTESINYNEYLYYSNTFSATSDILSLTFSSANLTNYPSNFTNYYFNEAESTNYAIYGNNFTINNLVGDTLYNNNDFNIRFTYYDTTQIQRTQITENPRTDENTVVFEENLIANRTFSYWYLFNSYDINSVYLNHTRTENIIEYTDFTIEGSKHYFEESSFADDQYVATVDYNPGWQINHSVTFDNGTTCYLEITYQTTFDISNVTLVLDLMDDNLYAENWTNNATQSSIDYILEVPFLNFTTSQQTITLTGLSSVPYCTLLTYENEHSFTIDSGYEDLNEWMRGFLTYSKYSKSWIIYQLDHDWTLDGIHYTTNDYDINSNGVFTCSGWGTGISTSYLRFKTNPVDDVYRWQEKNKVIYVIDMNFEAEDVDVHFYIHEDENVKIKSSNLDEEDYVDIVSLYSSDNKHYFEIKGLDLDRGNNRIEIIYEVITVSDDLWLLLPLGALVVVGILIFSRYRYELLDKDAWLGLLFFWKKEKNIKSRTSIKQESIASRKARKTKRRSFLLIKQEKKKRKRNW